MAYLYKNVNGYEVHRHSYSASSDFRQCPTIYKLKRIEGYRERINRATAQFGNAFEAAIKHFHDQSMKSGLAAKHFIELWNIVKADTTLDYKDSSWDEMLVQGTEMCRLYEAVLPSLPIKQPRFQLFYEKELFPGSYLSNIKFIAYVDIISELGDSDYMIIDVKTSSMPLQDKLINLDPQLRAYSWVSGISKVAFLYFTRKVLGIKKGDKVTLLVPLGKDRFAPGTELIVLVAPSKDSSTLYLLTEEDYDTYKKESSGLKGNAAKEVVEKYATEHAFSAMPGDVTKQRLQFSQAVISKDEQWEEGEKIGRDVAEIVSSREKNKFRQNNGIRFPNDQCNFCSLRGICSHNEKLADELLIRPKPAQNTKDDKEWLDSLERDKDE
jgi:RecB family exonuclease